MGGRGGASGFTADGALEHFRKAGVRVYDEDLKGLNKTLVDKTLTGVIDTLKEFGLPLTIVNSIGVSLSKNAEASANGFGDFGFGEKAFSSKEKEFSFSDFSIDSTARGVGTHEAGHIISNYAMRKNNSDLSLYEKAKLRSSGKWDRKILKEAKKINGGTLSAISKYGSNSKGKAAGEVVAEAVSEYMKSRKRASPSSKAIVKVLKSYL